MEIREATPDDAPALEQLVAAFVEEPPYGVLFPDTPPEKVSALVRSIINRDDTFVIVAEAEGQIIGTMAAVIVCHPLLGPYADEVFWQIVPAWRAAVFNVAPLLLGTLHGWATAEGLGHIRMTAPAGSGLGRFYERHGYVEVETSYAARLNI